MIRLSIVFLASELARQRRGEVGPTVRYPWLVAFSFGLRHGFAGAPAEIGLPETAIPLALLMFSLGVEAASCSSSPSSFPPSGSREGWSPPAPRRVGGVPAHAIGPLAAFWLIQRVAALGQVAGAGQQEHRMKTLHWHTQRLTTVDRYTAFFVHARVKPNPFALEVSLLGPGGMA